MNIINNEDTIAALATPAGQGAIAVIRISGPQSITRAGKVFRGRIALEDAPSHTIHYGKILTSDDSVIDDVLVSVFRAPHSYTGEDSIEISTHGSQLIVQKIISLLADAGVRTAEPGEFTKRAFLNGRLDLAQAEAVADIINSRTEASLRGARNQLDGILSAGVSELRNSLLTISSLMELELDFAEEEIELIPTDESSEMILKITCKLQELLDSYSFGRVIRDGVNIALVGKPNVGKSSLLNYLLKESRAIVSEVPGTTRDVIREELNVEGVLLRLFDTAGIRNTHDMVEKEGVLRSRQAVEQSDLVLFISDVTDGIDHDILNELEELVTPSRIIKVLNKLDLKPGEYAEADICISSRTGYGINSLLKMLKDRAAGSDSYSEKAAIVTNIRHFTALKKAKESLLTAEESLRNGFSGEFVAADIRNAINSLDEIIGKVTTDDILNNIFSSFCIGK